MKQPGGNGASKIPIHQDDVGGWVRVFTDKLGPLPEDFHFYLSATLTEWFRQRPQLLLQAVVPINRDGNTVELHAWYHVHALPPRQGPGPSEERKG
jgi:hypothetical protein